MIKADIPESKQERVQNYGREGPLEEMTLKVDLLGELGEPFRQEQGHREGSGRQRRRREAPASTQGTEE